MRRFLALLGVAIVGAFSTSAAFANCETGFFRQHVTGPDRLNSSGKLLTDPATILRQERFWFHAKSVRDPLDTPDHITASKDARGWYGDAVARHISFEDKYTIEAGDFVAVVSYDTCQFINEQGKRDVDVFINYVDIAPYEDGTYPVYFRYVDPQAAKDIIGLDVPMADLGAQSFDAYSRYMDGAGIRLAADDAMVAFIPKANVYVFQIGACNDTCPFAIVDEFGQERGQFQAGYGFRYTLFRGQSVLMSMDGTILAQLPN